MSKLLILIINLISILFMPIAIVYTAWKWAVEFIDGVTE
jgi:hypothetical protein